jgi:hypothetical protein
VEYESWPTNRDGDSERQRQIIGLLTEGGAPAEHVAAITAEVGNVRFRPEEVGGASIATVLPASFSEACNNAKWILVVLFEQGLVT